MLSKTLSASLLVAAASAAGGTPFNYVDIGDNWMAPDFPDADCRNGREQSPVDLVKSTFSTEAGNNKMKFEGYNYNDWPTGQVILKETHSLKMPISDPGTLRTQFPDQTTDSFTSAQLHFHAPSEHSVNGELLPLEMHIVHVHEDPTKFSVLGIFFVVGDEENEYIKSLQFDKATEAGHPLTDVNLGTFLSGLDMSKFWHYDGSFTTPPCTEGVKWWVLEEPVTITQAQLDAFTAYNWGNADYANGYGNNRRTQPLNDRTLYFRDSSEGSNAVALAVSSMALALLALF